MPALGGQAWGTQGNPNLRGQDSPTRGPYSPEPHSSTEEPHLFLWTYFNLTKSANY